MNLLPIAALSFEGVRHPWLWVAAVLAGAGVLYWTYKGMFSRSDGRLGWLLMALRGAGLAALVLALAKPTWTHESELVDPGRLAVVLDDSASMALPDPGGKSRYARAVEAVAMLRGALDADRSAPRLELDLFDINGEPIAGNPPAKPTAGRTDLARGVAEAAARLRSRPLAGVVLLSDGMDTTGRPDLRELAELPVPIFAVGFRPDPSAAGLDLAVRRVKAPERAMVHNEIKVDVVVTKTGGPATRAKVVLRRGRESFASEPVAFGPGDGERTVRLPLTPAQAGRFVFAAEVEPAPGERLTANNAAPFPLRVDAEPIRVLYLEGFLRYESKYLKNRLEDDPDVALAYVVRRANPERAETRGDDVLTAERLKGLDVVILGDMEASYLGDAESRALLAWQDEKDRALLVLGGYHSFGPDGLRSTPLAEALPVAFADREPYHVEEPFALKLTDAGSHHPIFELSGDRARDAADWSSAPRLQGRAVVRRAKPGAVVLAVDPGDVVDGQPAIVAAVQRFGGGHTMVLAADTTWRWSRLTRVAGQADTLYARFWSQALRWLSGRGGDDRRAPLVVSTDRTSYDVGKSVSVRVERQPKAGVDLAGSEVVAEVTGPGGKPIPLAMHSSSAEPDVFAATFYPSTGGRHEVAAGLSAGGKVLANASGEFLVNGPDLELADPGTNRPALRSIALATGGAYVGIEDAPTLAAQVPRKERRTSQVRRAEFWDSPALFVAFLAAVSAEWFLRRRHHLA